MASLDDIREYDDAPLDDLERELIRSALNIDGRAGEAIYDDSEERMALLTPPQRSIMRKLLNVDLPAVDEDRDTKIVGAGDGTYYNPSDRDNWVQREMRRMLYPDLYNNPATGTNKPKGGISYVTARYASGSAEFK